MGINQKSPEQLAELQSTLEACEWIKEVHFTKDGNHYFNLHKLAGKSYGFLRTKQEVAEVRGERKIYKHKSVHTPEAEITQTLSREEVLNYDESKLEGKTPAKRGRKSKLEEAA